MFPGTSKSHHAWLVSGFVTDTKQAAGILKGAKLSTFMVAVTLQAWLQAGEKYNLDACLGKN